MSINRNEAIALRESRQRAHAHLTTLLGKERTPEVRGQMQKVMNDIEVMTSQITKIENPGQYVAENRYVTEGDVDHASAFNKWIRGGLDNLSVEQRKVLTSKVETRDLSEGGSQIAHVGSYSSLGFFVPTGFVDRVEQAKKWYSSFDDVCQVMKTATGNALPFPVSNDTAQKAVVITETSETTEIDGNTTNHVVFGAYKLKSGLIKCSAELLQDSSIDIDQWLAERFAERFGRGEEAYFTTGTGSGQPMGILTAIAASGATPVTAVGSAANTGGTEDGSNSIGWQDLVALEHSVDPSYRQQARYMLHDNVLSHLKTRLDKFGRPLWVPSVAVSEPSTINGYKYSINQSMASSVAPSATTMIFGDFSKFVVRRVASMSLKRLTERYAEFDEVGFLSFERVDSNLLDAGTHPLNVLIQHS